ncbi:PorP/SprF family type IX secretion system membrane protein [Maribellus sediminis]|uniref:PorP/SprF family type IX secretion system membrane protein n=1 Tax=Maribellus sediminis TaxID=2696285 RepID=UPI0014322832|nr:PorP/SprF family type IX secretion system membrane protein [Maribellus sediminis]
MKKRLLLFFTGILIFCVQSKAQTELGTTSHWYNRANYNPASIARPGYIYFFSNYRKQWSGIDGAPTVYNLQASGFSEKQNSAFGISMVRDEIGLTTAINPTFQYAYRVGIKENLDLSLGLAAGFYSRRLNASAYDPEVVDDPALDYTDQRFASPDANFGLELEGKHFIAGLSSSHLFALWNHDDEYLITNHQYVYALYKNTDSELYNLTAGIQLSRRNNVTIFEGSGIIRIKMPTGLQKGPRELLDLGLTYRSTNQLTLLTGLNITRNFRIGYTYDFNFGIELNGNSTHEIVLEYRIPLKLTRYTNYIWYN